VMGSGGSVAGWVDTLEFEWVEEDAEEVFSLECGELVLVCARVLVFMGLRGWVISRSVSGVCGYVPWVGK